MLKVLSKQELQDAMEQSIPAYLTQEKLDEYAITREQEQNLRTLVIGLERLLPTHEHLFNMNKYYDEDCYFTTQDATVENPCGTSACAVGFAPSCGIKMISGEGWVDFAYRVFGGQDIYSDESNSINSFMFAGNWYHEKNQMREAIARIKLVLAGKAPKDFNFTDSYINWE